MIPKTKKLDMRKDFLEFKKVANKLSSPNLLLYSLKSEEPKYEVVVPKDSVKKAANRNKFKRILKKTLLDNSPAHSSVVLVTSRPLIKDEKSLENELIELLEKQK